MEPSPNARTVASYEEIAADYAQEASGHRVLAGALTRLAETVPTGEILEIGSGPGWDADQLEDAGLSVRRTDITQAFIDLQVARGKQVDRLDVMTDDLGGPYDAVVMLHVLQHVEPKDLSVVLAKVAAALRPGGRFLVSIPRGVGAGWEVGESGTAYYRALRTKEEFIAALSVAGFAPEWTDQSSDDEGWLVVLGRLQPGYDALADVYDRTFPDAYSSPEERMAVELLAEAVRDAAVSGAVIDVGCGTGHQAHDLQSRGLTVIGVDPSRGMLEHARRRFPDLQLVQGDASLDAVAPALITGILARFSLIHVAPEQLPMVFSSWAERVESGAAVMVAFQAAEPGLGPYEEFDHVVARAWRWTPDAMVAMLETAGFAERWRLVVRPTEDYHRFPECHVLVVRESSSSVGVHKLASELKRTVRGDV